MGRTTSTGPIFLCSRFKTAEEQNGRVSKDTGEYFENSKGPACSYNLSTVRLFCDVYFWLFLEANVWE
jgi:hypothetical protein